MLTKKLYVHQTNQNDVLNHILVKMHLRGVKYHFLNSASPPNVLNKVRNMNYNPIIYFLVCAEVGEEVSFRFLRSECEFKSYVNYLNLEEAEYVHI